MNFEQIFDRVADHEQTFELINRGYSPDVRRAGQWFETTQESFDYFLNVLPPLDWISEGFTMCEFSTGFLTDAYLCLNGRYYCLCVHRVTESDFRNTVQAFRAHLAGQVGQSDGE